MKSSELAVLEALVKRLRQTSRQLGDESLKVYETAGYTYEDGGTGDEGWSKSLELSGESTGYIQASIELERIIKCFKQEIL